MVFPFIHLKENITWKFIQLVVESKALPAADRGVLLNGRLHAKVRVWGINGRIRLHLLG